MISIGKEAMDFVRACEAILALLARGDTLTPEERGLIQFRGIEVLSRVRPATLHHFIPATRPAPPNRTPRAPVLLGPAPAAPGAPTQPAGQKTDLPGLASPGPPYPD